MYFPNFSEKCCGTGRGGLTVNYVVVLHMIMPIVNNISVSKRLHVLFLSLSTAMQISFYDLVLVLCSTIIQAHAKRWGGH